MNGDADELWAAYTSTTYRADTPLGALLIRVGNVAPGLDALLAQHDATDWAFITAHNPGSKRLSDADNKLRNDRLKTELSTLGFLTFPGDGIGDDLSWPPEQSLLIIGMSQSHAIAFGRKYGQNAVICGSINRPAELIDCRPPHRTHD